MKKRLILTILVLILFTLFPIKAEARDLEVTYVNQYSIEDREKINVKVSHAYKNVSELNVISNENTETFLISTIGNDSELLEKSVKTVKVTYKGRELPYSIVQKENFAEIKVQYPAKILPNGEMTLVLEYENYGLIQNYGAIYDIFIPGIPKGIEYETAKQKVDITTEILVDVDLFPEKNFILPIPNYESVEDKKIARYTYANKALEGKTIWLQMGTKQYYKFEVRASLDATTDIDLGQKNTYEIIIPRDVNNLEFYQKVYYDFFSHTPDEIKLDENDNLIVVYHVKSSEEMEVLITGYAEVGATNIKLNQRNSGTLDDYNNYDKDFLGQYLSDAKYWEVKNPKITDVVNRFTPHTTNIEEILNRTFSYVVDRINYLSVDRFGGNERRGAVGTLTNGSGVCMEYSDLFLTLARAQGIPTRAAFGFGFDPRAESNVEGHQWVISFIPTFGQWYDIDVAWGDSTEHPNGYILNHFYTHIASVSPETPPEMKANIYGDKDKVYLPVYTVSPIAKIPSVVRLTEQKEVLNLAQKEQGVEDSEKNNNAIPPTEVNKTSRTTSVSNILGVVLIIIGLVTLVIVGFLLFKKFKKKKPVVRIEQKA